MHLEKISLKNLEVEALKENLAKTNRFVSSLTVWDKDKGDFIEVPHAELELTVVGSVCVDSARLMVCDPYYLNPLSENEAEGVEMQKFMFQVVETGVVFCTSFADISLDLELLGLDEDLTWEQMVDQGKLKRLDYSGEFPAIPSTYIRGDLQGEGYKQINHYSFLNGRLGAGVSISLMADGIYPVSIESYKGAIQRIIIDV